MCISIILALCTFEDWCYLIEFYCSKTITARLLIYVKNSELPMGYILLQCQRLAFIMLFSFALALFDSIALILRFFIIKALYFL